MNCQVDISVPLLFLTQLFLFFSRIIINPLYHGVHKEGGEHIMTYTVLGIFNDRNDAEHAIMNLQQKDFEAKNISIVMKDQEEGKKLAEHTGTDVAGNAVTGITTGAVVGGLAGLLGAFIIPGLGAFLIGGPISAALGLTGAAASTISGAATGAVAGGILGALMGLGLPKEEAEEYEERINNGGILVAVPSSDLTFSTAQDILMQCNATDVKTISMPNETTSTSAKEKSTVRKNRSSSQYYPQATYASYGMKGGETGTKKGRKSSIKRTSRAGRTQRTPSKHT